MRPRRCQHFCAVAPVLPRQLRPASSCRSAPLTPVEQGHQLCRGQRDPAGRGGRTPVELPLFEPLRQHAKANAVMPDQFDQSGTTATEGIQSSVEGVLCQALLHQHRQANGTFPHVRDPARQVDASTWRKCDHRPSSAPRTRRKALPSTSASTHTETPPGSTISISPFGRDNAAGDEVGTIDATGSALSSCCAVSSTRAKFGCDLVTTLIWSPRICCRHV